MAQARDDPTHRPQIDDDELPAGVTPPQREQPQSDHKKFDTGRSPEMDHVLSLFKDKSGFKQLTNLEPDQAQAYADMLDAYLDEREPHSKTRKQRLKCLQRLCGTYGILPSSFILPDTFDGYGSMPFATGGYSHVYRMTFQGRPVAVKHLVVNTGEEERLRKMRRLLAREVVGWKWLRHENILPFIGVTPELAIVSDLMEHGNIMEFTKNHPRHNRLHLLMGAATGLEYIHNHSIVHGDLKGLNILVDSRHSACLADFGLAMIIDESTIGTTASGHGLRGTTRWMAPELLIPEEYGFSGDCQRRLPSTSTDIYALGMTILEVCVSHRGAVECWMSVTSLVGNNRNTAFQ
ncbi:kinase-like protein [Thelephora ganbajun]|uniref:Kinase-like protein n=1 Tax=Thelephora ganbajun TaxID=370292 RepID=A0ACB6ZE39_THEGA|nr:kinase-like protein [Thelephora ganbajun]